MTMEPQQASPISKMDGTTVELGCQTLLGHFGSVYLLQVSKNDDKEHCFLK